MRVKPVAIAHMATFLSNLISVILEIEFDLVAKLSCQEYFEEIAEKLPRVRIFVLATWSKMDLSNSISCAISTSKWQWIAIKHA